MIDEGVPEEEVMALYSESLGVKIQKSNIHGNGLFATKNFSKGFCLWKQ